jgi:hypothetical protein
MLIAALSHSYTDFDFCVRLGYNRAMVNLKMHQVALYDLQNRGLDNVR